MLKSSRANSLYSKSLVPLPLINNVKDVLRGLLTLGLLEVQNVAILFEHVNLVKASDGLDVELLEGCLELLVLPSGSLWFCCHLAPGSPLAACGVWSEGGRRGEERGELFWEGPCDCQPCVLRSMEDGTP